MDKQTTPKHVPLIIIGAGPAGFTASVYASRYQTQHLVIGNILGGQVSKSTVVENYPPFKEIKGYELALKFREHAEHYMQYSNSKIVFDTVKSVKKQKDNTFAVETNLNGTFTSNALIIAIGVKKRELNVPGEAKFLGKGVVTCTTCDGFLYRDKIVGVVGGGDSAATSALYLADITPKVYMFVRRDQLRAEPFWQQKLKKNKKIHILYNTQITEILGDQKLTSVKTNTGKTIDLDGLFIEIGYKPDINFLKDLNLETDQEGYIKVDKEMQTSVTGVFSAGDITTASNKFKQIVVATAEGAIAANSAFLYLQKNR